MAVEADTCGVQGDGGHVSRSRCRARRWSRSSSSGETIQAKLGSMVAYQGDVKFEHAGSGGLKRMAKKAVTGEGAELMKVSGHRRGLPRRPGAGDPAAEALGRGDHRERRQPAGLRRRHRLGHQEGRGRLGIHGRRHLQHAPLGRPATWRCSPTGRRSCSSSTASRPSPTRRRRSPGRRGSSTSVKTDVNLKTFIGTRLGRERPAGVLRQGLAADPAVRGAGDERRGGRLRRRLERRRRDRQAAQRLSAEPGATAARRSPPDPLLDGLDRQQALLVVRLALAVTIVERAEEQVLPGLFQVQRRGLGEAAVRIAELWIPLGST